MRLIAPLTLALAFLAAAPARAQQVTVGTANADNCIPFGCDFDVARYQQVFDGAAFGGPTGITALSFTLKPWGASHWLAGATYTLRLGYTSAAVGALNAALDDNVQGALTTFATRSFAINTPAPAVLTFTGLAPFAFDPAGGNLLLDILVDGQVGADVGGYANFASENGGTATSRAYTAGGLTGTSAVGLVTRFDVTAPVTTAPEPATVTLLGAGLLALAGAGARRRVASAR
jgi:hypothetical protein